MTTPEPRHSTLTRQQIAVRVILLFGALTLVGVGLFIVATVPPTQQSWYPKCLSYQITQMHCPGCGTTRALHALLNGDLSQALAYNILIPLTLPLFSYYLLKSLYYWIIGSRPKPKRYRRFVDGVLPWILMVFLLLFGVIRNLPYEPFTRLAPHELTDR